MVIYAPLTDAGSFASFAWWVLRMFALHRVVELNVGFQQALLTERLVTVLKRTLVAVVFRLNDKGFGRERSLRDQDVVHYQNKVDLRIKKLTN